MKDRAPREITLAMMRDHLYAAVVSDALDACGCPNHSPRVELRPWTMNRLLVGRCKTTLWADMYHQDPRPYDLELKAVDACRPDDVLIAAAGGSIRSGVWGELLTTAAKNQGCVGAVVDGAIRDVTAMTRLEFPVFARATSVFDSKDRQRVVDLDVVVEIDGVPFAPGDLVLADRDGVVVVPQEIEAEVIPAAWNKVHAEDESRAAIERGMKATEAFQKYGVL